MVSHVLLRGETTNHVTTHGRLRVYIGGGLLILRVIWGVPAGVGWGGEGEGGEEEGRAEGLFGYLGSFFGMVITSSIRFFFFFAVPLHIIPTSSAPTTGLPHSRAINRSFTACGVGLLPK